MEKLQKLQQLLHGRWFQLYTLLKRVGRQHRWDYFEYLVSSFPPETEPLPLEGANLFYYYGSNQFQFFYEDEIGKVRRLLIPFVKEVQKNLGLLREIT